MPTGIGKSLCMFSLTLFDSPTHSTYHTVLVSWPNSPNRLKTSWGNLTYLCWFYQHSAKYLAHRGHSIKVYWINVQGIIQKIRNEVSQTPKHQVTKLFVLEHSSPIVTLALLPQQQSGQVTLWLFICSFFNLLLFQEFPLKYHFFRGCLWPPSTST